jgi:hypothetical protein
LEPHTSPDRAFAGMSSKNMEVKKVLNKLITRMIAVLLLGILEVFPVLLFSRFMTAFIAMA